MRPSTSPPPSRRSSQRATQAIADALQREIAAAPEQWYSFKPMWPPDAADQEALARRRAEMQTGTGRRRGSGRETPPSAAASGAPEPAASGLPPATAADA